MGVGPIWSPYENPPPPNLRPVDTLKDTYGVKNLMYFQAKGDGSDQCEASLQSLISPGLKLRYVKEQTKRVAKDLQEELTRSSEASASISMFPQPERRRPTSVGKSALSCLNNELSIKSSTILPLVFCCDVKAMALYLFVLLLLKIKTRTPVVITNIIEMYVLKTSQAHSLWLLPLLAPFSFTLNHCLIIF